MEQAVAFTAVSVVFILLGVVLWRWGTRQGNILVKLFLCFIAVVFVCGASVNLVRFFYRPP